MSFITKTDYDASIHAEILDAIIRQDDTILDIVAGQAQEEVAGYLTARYDTDAIFGTTGTARPGLIVQFCKDIVLYNLHSMVNPTRFPEIRKDRYDRAIAWLKSVQKGDINPVNLPLRANADSTVGAENGYQIASTPKRQNHY